MRETRMKQGGRSSTERNHPAGYPRSSLWCLLKRGSIFHRLPSSNWVPTGCSFSHEVMWAPRGCLRHGSLCRLEKPKAWSPTGGAQAGGAVSSGSAQNWQLKTSFHQRRGWDSAQEVAVGFSPIAFFPWHPCFENWHYIIQLPSPGVILESPISLTTHPIKASSFIFSLSFICLIYIFLFLDLCVVTTAH